MRTCQQCDHQMADTTEICPVCGQTWAEFHPSEGRKDRVGTAVRWTIYGLIGIALLLFLYSLFVWL